MKDVETVIYRIRDSQFPNDLEDKIFTPFFTTKPKGNGPGLFISRQIIKDIDGEINISSDSSGTLVTVSFPLCKQKT